MASHRLISKSVFTALSLLISVGAAYGQDSLKDPNAVADPSKATVTADPNSKTGTMHSAPDVTTGGPSRVASPAAPADPATGDRSPVPVTPSNSPVSRDYNAVPPQNPSNKFQNPLDDIYQLAQPGPGPTTATTGLPPDQQNAPVDASGLSNNQRADDYGVVNTQAEEFRQRFLQGEAIELRLPRGEELMPLGDHLPPIRLEASYTAPVALRDVVSYNLNNNLDIRIQNEQVLNTKWLAVGAFTRFLPDALMSYRSQYQAGTTLIGGILPLTYGNPFVTVSAGFRYYGFRGGSVLFGALQNLHQYRAAKQAYRATINDSLFNVTQNYYDLVRNQALLQIQTRAVEVAKAQVLLNRQLERAGTGTRFQVLQSETQLARDEQALLTQEVALRRASIDLATRLNFNTTVNLLSVEKEVRKVRLIDPSADINRLINVSFANRPELKQFEQLRIAAKRNIQVQAAPLYPQFQFFGQYAGNGQTLSRDIVLSQPSVSAVPLAGPYTSSSVISNATSGNPSVVTNNTLPAGYVFNPPTYVNRQVRKSYQIGMELDWNFIGMGGPDVANIQAARATARQASLRVNQTIMNVIQQVRTSYLQSQTAERQIEVATKEVVSSAEELRLSGVRLANGVGTNIDVINAQRDFIQALVRKAEAIIQFNIQQAQLLRDIGVISYDTLTSGRLTK